MALEMKVFQGLTLDGGLCDIPRIRCESWSTATSTHKSFSVHEDV